MSESDHWNGMGWCNTKGIYLIFHQEYNLIHSSAHHLNKSSFFPLASWHFNQNLPDEVCFFLLSKSEVCIWYGWNGVLLLLLGLPTTGFYYPFSGYQFNISYNRCVISFPWIIVIIIYESNVIPHARLLVSLSWM